MEMMTSADNQSQDFYGKVIDQYGQPVVGADVTLGITLAIGRQVLKTNRCSGPVSFTGIKGLPLNITPKKEGYQIEGHGLGLKGLTGRNQPGQSSNFISCPGKSKGRNP